MNESLRQELLAMYARDQEMRNTVASRWKSGEPLSPEDAAWWAEIDTSNTRRMQEIVAAHGWPGVALVGQEGANAAWLLVQHADKNVDFQERCLELMRAAVAVGDASAKDLAYLIDRVRVNTGQPQVYGTQCHDVEGELASREIEDAAQVDERRAQVGLGALAEYLVWMRSL